MYPIVCLWIFYQKPIFFHERIAKSLVVCGPHFQPLILNKKPSKNILDSAPSFSIVVTECEFNHFYGTVHLEGE